MVFDVLIDGLSSIFIAFITVGSESIVRVFLHESYLFLQFLHKHSLDNIEGALCDATNVKLLALLTNDFSALDIEEQEEGKLAIDCLGVKSIYFVDDVQFTDDSVFSLDSLSFDAAVAYVAGVGDGFCFFFCVHDVSHVVNG